ncbi:MAG: beta-ketoacyl-ACP synthase 3, partial [Bdellovibrionota bacterium]
TTDEWIWKRSGIRERRFIDDDSLSNSDLGVRAAELALANAGVDRSEIDHILYATLSPDHEFPGTGCFFQAKMKMPGVPVTDIRNQCTGFLFATVLANGLIAGGSAKKVLVVGAELHSRGLDLSTRGRDVAVLFGDGAGAMVIGESGSAPGEGELTGLRTEASRRPRPRGILASKLHADGAFARELWVRSPGVATLPYLSPEMLLDGSIYPQMNGRTVFVHAVRRMPEVVREVLAEQNLTVADIDLFVPHQANLRINEAVAESLGISRDRVFNTIEKFGNTTAATIPIGLAEAERAGRLKPGMLVAVAAFGSGFTWGSILIRW